MFNITSMSLNSIINGDISVCVVDAVVVGVVVVGVEATVLLLDEELNESVAADSLPLLSRSILTCTL